MDERTKWYAEESGPWMRKESVTMFETDTHGHLYLTCPYPETLDEAWDITLAKWEYLIKNPIRDGGISTCGLCLFCDDCSDCPVGQRLSGGCDFTPYRLYGKFVDSGAKSAARVVAKEILAIAEQIKKDSGQ